MAEILVGTASWTDRSLIRSHWYPKGVNSAEERLRFYATQFPLVEADASYYFIPTDQVVTAWRDRTPAGFVFNAKAFALLTQHPARSDALPDGMAPEGKPRVYLRHLDPEAIDDIWAQFVDALDPLHRAGKLGAVLFQFPPWFTLKRANKEYVQECVSRMAPLPIVVELRNQSWFRNDNLDETMAFFRDQNIPLASVDTARGDRSSVPPLGDTTSSALALVRLHGRGRAREGLTRQAAAGAYLYPARVLRQWVPIVKSLAEQAKTVHVVFRNAYRDYAVRNAAQFQRTLARAGLDVRSADDRAGNGKDHAA